MMRRLLPYPLLWLALFAMWLLANDSVALVHILAGAVIATLACLALVALEPPKPRIRRVGTIVQLVALVLGDIFASNIAVFRLIVSGRAPRSVFVTIPLDLRDPNGLAVLACIVTATPGSAWVHHDSKHSTVIIHVLDTADGAEWSAMLKRNYEQRLLEIFR
jgi:multicomponent K+:H+ antiporter subunit E